MHPQSSFAAGQGPPSSWVGVGWLVSALSGKTLVWAVVTIPSLSHRPLATGWEGRSGAAPTPAVSKSEIGVNARSPDRGLSDTNPSILTSSLARLMHTQRQSVVPDPARSPGRRKARKCEWLTRDRVRGRKRLAYYRARIAIQSDRREPVAQGEESRLKGERDREGGEADPNRGCSGTEWPDAPNHSIRN